MRSKERGWVGVMSLLGSPHTGFFLCEMTQLPKPVISFGLFFCERWLSNQDYPKQSSHTRVFLCEMTELPETVISYGLFSVWDDSETKTTQTSHLIRAFFCVRWFSNSDYPKQSSHPGLFLSEMTRTLAEVPGWHSVGNWHLSEVDQSRSKSINPVNPHNKKTTAALPEAFSARRERQWFVLVRLAAHVSNGWKSRIRPVVGRI